LRPEKNVRRLLEAFASVREKADCRLVIAGDGPERAPLEAMARQLLPGGSYLFTGHIERVERVYSALDIFALTSDTEQMPTSLMEAMAAGLPVAATNVGDIMQMVTAENRSFIVPRETQLFADALFHLVRDGSARERIGGANGANAQTQFGIARMFRDYDALFSTGVNSVFAGGNARP